MPNSSDLSGWAEEIIDCGGYSGTSVDSVVCWLESNLGFLNLAIEESFSLVSGTISPEMSLNAMAVYTQMYECYMLNKYARRSTILGTEESGWIEIRGEEQGTIKRPSPVEAAKVYRTLAKDCKECLEDLISWYNGTHKGNAEPLQVLTSTMCTSENGMPPEYLLSPRNCCWR